MLLSNEEIEKKIKGLGKWKRTGAKIIRDFIFENFDEAVKFVNKVHPVASEVAHYPDVFIYFNRVRLEIMDHDQGGLTEKDFELAQRIDRISK